MAALNAALEAWHRTPGHERGKRPKAVVAYVGNKDREVHSARNLQRRLNGHLTVAERLARGA